MVWDRFVCGVVSVDVWGVGSEGVAVFVFAAVGDDLGREMRDGMRHRIFSGIRIGKRRKTAMLVAWSQETLRIIGICIRSPRSRGDYSIDDCLFDPVCWLLHISSLLPTQVPPFSNFLLNLWMTPFPFYRRTLLAARCRKVLCYRRVECRSMTPRTPAELFRGIGQHFRFGVEVAVGMEIPSWLREGCSQSLHVGRT